MSLLTVKNENRENVSVSNNVFFAKHETFHPRSGWLKKGFDAVIGNPDIFSLPDAHILLGVGKNMANAIKYWCLAFKLILPINESVKTPSNRLHPSEFGNLLLKNDGWDPWLEDSASLWLLHWNLLKLPSQATAWHFMFNEFRKMEFNSDDMIAELIRFRDQFGLTVAESSLRKDALCILRMYSSQEIDHRGKRFTGEDTLECPFVDLGLIQRSGDTQFHQFRYGSKSNLPPEIIVASCLDFVGEIAPGQKTLSIANLLYTVSSPGLVFKLTEGALCRAIETVSLINSGISLTDSAGLLQFSFDGEPDLLAKMILENYYA